MTNSDIRVIDLPNPRTDREQAVDLAAAEEFLRLFHSEQRTNRHSFDLQARIAEVDRQVKQTGCYRHTTAELEFGARVAWRNSARCIGRLYWNSLYVRDRRSVSTTDAVADECVGHLREATRGGKLRSTITVFAPDTADGPGPRIWNEQLIRYAGYLRTDDSVLGDPRNLAFTEFVRSLGWRPPAPRTRFDVLPLVIECPRGRIRWYELPADSVLEVSLSHPDMPWFSHLGLRWHAVPAISCMRLLIGGVQYPIAFSGTYMSSEVGCRNLADESRYNLLPMLAERMGLPTDDDRTLWRDRTMVELTLAVQHSFTSAGVSITDHHTESRRFLTHLRREEAAGRTCPADWSWIVPPISGSQTAVFHRYYDEPDDTTQPAFITPDGPYLS
ncbi:nitric-oxide synthase [Amycolatopsis xylanica]|uniref:Nitric oxide synthase oxygenase n=1 Tax=Amycolatopsis xylanica TaxID=589385 RepID=A0A1H2UQH6_9PSEU|nr:nitric oxide synthase oxygenase [Amycolatopsis xylanica]SDW58188.1 nitric-oxide synthase [Amycolatopsis xylanica]